MNIDEVINVDGRFLKAIDLKGRKIGVRIESYTVEDFKDLNGQSKRQIVLKFRGATKVLGLNKVNTQMIASMYGKEADDWIGKEVILFPTKTQGPRGDIVDCVRVEYRLPEPAKAPPPRSQQPQAARPHMSEMQQPPPPASPADYGTDMDDDIPF